MASAVLFFIGGKLMERMFGYMLKHIQDTENNIEGICKVLIKQKRFNNIVAIFSVLTTVHICLLHNRLDIRNNKIDVLVKEIEELKEMKGE